MRRAFLTLALLLTLQSPTHAERLDGVVAAIEYNAIMLSTLKAYQQAFAADQPAAIALEAMINDNLLAREAQRYGQTITNDVVVKEAAKLKTPGTLTPVEWQQLLATHLLAKRFLEFRFGDFVPVSREEIRAYYESHRNRYTGSLEESEEAIRQLLVPAVRARRIAAYEEELRTRYNVRLNRDVLPKE